MNEIKLIKNYLLTYSTMTSKKFLISLWIMIRILVFVHDVLAYNRKWFLYPTDDAISRNSRDSAEDERSNGVGGDSRDKLIFIASWVAALSIGRWSGTSYSIRRSFFAFILLRYDSDAHKLVSLRKKRVRI